MRKVLGLAPIPLPMGLRSPPPVVWWWMGGRHLNNGQLFSMMNLLQGSLDIAIMVA